MHKTPKSWSVAQQHCNEANLRVFAEMTRNETATLQKVALWSIEDIQKQLTRNSFELRSSMQYNSLFLI